MKQERVRRNPDHMPGRLSRHRPVPASGRTTHPASPLRPSATTLDRPAEVTDNIAKILGRPAVTFEQWVRDHPSLFVN